MATQTSFTKFNFSVDEDKDTNNDKKTTSDKVNKLIANEVLGYQEDAYAPNPSKGKQQSLHFQEDAYSESIGSDGGELFCSHCLKLGHIIKTCPSAVVSYGLICYLQKHIIVGAGSQSNNFFNKRTKKQGNMKNRNNNINYRNGHNVPRIKILKRHEIINHTLKNMMGLTSADNELDELNACENQNGYENREEYDMETYNEENNECVGVQAKPKQTKEINTYNVILVQRRNTIGFIEFMRGKYEIENHQYIIKLFNMLTFDEKRILREYEAFDAIRKIIGMERENIYKREYDDSKAKFEALRNHADGNMIFKLLDKSVTHWNSPEWGIPKGRRKGWMPSGSINSSSGELDIDCAVREFVEETGIKYNNLIVYRNVKPLEELYEGINGVLYKHVYYLAMVKDTEEARANVETVERGGQYNFEVSNVKCFGLSECHRIIRPYYVSKLNTIKKGFQLINCINQYFE